MKTKIVIEVETNFIDTVLPEEGQSEEEDFNTPELKEELKEYREEFTNDVHNAIVNLIKLYAQEGVEQEFMDSEYTIEGYDELKEYNTKITVK